MSTEHSAPGDAWVECGCGSRHWGRYGAAGLLLTDGSRVVLQHRAQWSHHGGTWALPGGALRPGESPCAGALREAVEEAGIDPTAVRVVATSILQHPDWSYTSVIARSDDIDVAATDAESLEVRWVPVAEVAARPLLPAFADAWPTLSRMLDGVPDVVIDVANVVGSRPDGWWRDRLGATTRLLAELDGVAADGVPAALLDLPGETWWPRWHAVVEGRARGARSTPRITVVEAPGSGDDAIVGLVEGIGTGVAGTAVVTADRGLQARIEAAGGRVVRPSALLTLLDRPD